MAEEEAFPSFWEMRDRLMSLILAAQSHTTRRTPTEKYCKKRQVAETFVRLEKPAVSV